MPSMSFPQTANAYDTTRSTGRRLPVKFNAAGRARLLDVPRRHRARDYAIRTGGGLAIDDQGGAYVTGDTYSPDFPDRQRRADDVRRRTFDVFLAKIDTTTHGAAGLVYSTYLGGTGDDLRLPASPMPARSGRGRREAEAGFPDEERVQSRRSARRQSTTASSRSSTRPRSAPHRCCSRRISAATHLRHQSYDVAVDTAGQHPRRRRYALARQLPAGGSRSRRRSF